MAYRDYEKDLEAVVSIDLTEKTIILVEGSKWILADLVCSSTSFQLYLIGLLFFKFIYVTSTTHIVITTSSSFQYPFSIVNLPMYFNFEISWISNYWKFYFSILCILSYSGFPGDIFGDLFGGMFGGSPFGFGGRRPSDRRKKKVQPSVLPLKYVNCCAVLFQHLIWN